jgi:hypothetical protein
MRLTDGEKIESAEILSWRCAQLVDADFSPPLAARLAGDARYDLHALIELTERGCAPELAVRILAPVEAEGSVA